MPLPGFGKPSASGVFTGRPAIEARFARMFEQFPKMEFVTKDVFVSNIFALGSTNRIAIEFDNTLVNRQGKESHNSAVTVVTLRGGKIVAYKEYLFDPVQLGEEWGEA